MRKMLLVLSIFCLLFFVSDLCLATSFPLFKFHTYLSYGSAHDCVGSFDQNTPENPWELLKVRLWVDQSTTKTLEVYLVTDVDRTSSSETFTTSTYHVGTIQNPTANTVYTFYKDLSSLPILEYYIFVKAYPMDENDPTIHVLGDYTLMYYV